MLTADGCAKRRERLLQRLGKPLPNWLVLTDPVHLRYLANFHVEPFVLGGDFRGVLGIHRSGRSVLIHDGVPPDWHQKIRVDEVIQYKWYDCVTPAKGPRMCCLNRIVADTFRTSHVADNPFDSEAVKLYELIAELRRQKDDDEVAILQQCMKIGEAGQAWAMNNSAAGMTELELFRGVQSECIRSANRPATVYGDFVVSTGDNRMGGPPTDRLLQNGDLFILDFSVVLYGYRSDFTNTICIGGHPSHTQQWIFDICKEAMEAAEQQLLPDVLCQAVYDSAIAVFSKHGVRCPHHIGHGLGLAHPEDPYFVPFSTQTLLPGDVVTLEPGVYLPGNGLRIENNYLITETGVRLLSMHEKALAGS